MKVRPLIMDEAALAQVARVKAHAEANPYLPNSPAWKRIGPPGDQPDYVAQLGTYKAVFTITHANGEGFRHLSVSVPGTKYPHPAAVFMIADALGFTGWDQAKPARPARDWSVGLHKRDRCVVVAQSLVN